MRLLAGWVWNFFQADMAGGFLNWFADNWKHIALVLIIVGLVVDWLIWMIRWRPYWLWLRKRQIIYEEVERPRKRRIARPEPVRHMPKAGSQSEYDDPFAVGEIDPYALNVTSQKPAKAPAASADEDFWDTGADPYADSRAVSPYARPAAEKTPRAASAKKQN